MVAAGCRVILNDYVVHLLNESALAHGARRRCLNPIAIVFEHLSRSGSAKGDPFNIQSFGQRAHPADLLADGTDALRAERGVRLTATVTLEFAGALSFARVTGSLGAMLQSAVFWERPINVESTSGYASWHSSS